MKNRKMTLLGLVFLLIISLSSACDIIQEYDLTISENLKDKADIIQSLDIDEPLADELDSEDQSVTLIDGRGEEVEISKKPERVVILFASFLDIWIRNGGDIVGMVEPSEEYLMPEIEKVKKVGKRGSICLEKVMILNPDLVILSSNTSGQLDMISPLQGAGAEVLVLDYMFKDDYFEISKLFATINNKLDLYESDTEKIKREIQEIIEKVPEKDNPTAIIITSTKSNISVRTSNTTLGEMFKDLKVINIADLENNQEGTKDFSLEKILEQDPDFIFVQTLGSDIEAVKEKLKADVESSSAWSSLSAIKNDRYIILPKDLYTYKANHRYGEAYKYLAKILYPEIFN